jgi:hypothetical protein
MKCYYVKLPTITNTATRRNSEVTSESSGSEVLSEVPVIVYIPEELFIDDKFKTVQICINENGSLHATIINLQFS